ncbi:uncharacterized protein LOC125587819 [Brassica napus]|nr:uncharacterized protein LOC125587819 [Brassica napus]
MPMEVFLFRSFDEMILLANANILYQILLGKLWASKPPTTKTIQWFMANTHSESLLNLKSLFYTVANWLLCFPVTSRRLDSHGMVEENRGEAALPSARPVLEMTAECGGANSSEHRLFVKKTCIE